MFEFRRIGIFEAVLVLRAADAVIHGQILHGLHEQRDALDFFHLRLQPADDFAGACCSLLDAASS